MRKVCWFLIVVLLLGCLAGCHQQPPTGSEQSPEFAEVTFPDMIKLEMIAAKRQIEIQKYGKTGHDMGPWWTPEHPEQDGYMFYGIYDGYVMYCYDMGLTSIMDLTLANYTFHYSNIHALCAYKDGEFYNLQDLLNDGLIDEEAIRIAHEHYTIIKKIQNEYWKSKRESGG